MVAMSPSRPAHVRVKSWAWRKRKREIFAKLGFKAKSDSESDANERRCVGGMMRRTRKVKVRALNSARWIGCNYPTVVGWAEAAGCWFGENGPSSEERRRQVWPWTW